MSDDLLLDRNRPDSLPAARIPDHDGIAIGARQVFAVRRVRDGLDRTRLSESVSAEAGDQPGRIGG